MSTPTPTRHADLERRLRAAADAVPRRPVPTDAWIELESRLATRDGRHSRRFLAAAAVVALLLALVGAATFLDDGNPANGPASGSDDGDPWAPEHILGEPVVAETLTLGGEETRHELVLTDTDGKGPTLCDRYVSADSDSSSGGCTSRQPDADEPGVAIDWITGTTGNGDVHGLEAAVDSRVMKVQVWMSNGDETLALLHPTGWDDTKMFALTIPDNGPTPQRLVAYSDARGTVLQAVDLGALFGDDWLPHATACGTRTDQVSVSRLLAPDGSKESAGVDFGFSTASVRIVTGEGSTVGTQCLDLSAAGSAVASVTGTVAVVVTGPEVARLRVFGDAGTRDEDTAAVDRSPWRLVVLRLGSTDLDRVLISSLDGSGQTIDKQSLSDLRSTSPMNVTQE
jgi:hypothetical protein